MLILITSKPEFDKNNADYYSLFGEYGKNFIIYRFDPLFRRFWKIMEDLVKIKNYQI